MGGRSRPGGGRRRPRTLYRWHRRAGVAAAAFLLFLVITGVPLQYSGELDLGGRYVRMEAVLDWYGLQAPTDVTASAGLVAVGDALYLRSGQFVDTLAGFRGAVAVRGLVAVAGADAVLLVDPGSGERLDRFRRDGIRRIGRLDDQPVLDTDAGLVAADPALLNWAATDVAADAVAWAQPLPLGAAQAQPYRRQFRTTMLSVERLLQDIHSGRIGGAVGVVLVDIASALLTFLAVSGLVMWWRTLPR